MKQFFVAVMLLLFTIGLQAQTVVNVQFPINKYLHTGSCCSQPTLNQTEINKLVARATFFNVSAYGATVNDASNDLNAIASCVNAAIASTRSIKAIKFDKAGTYMLSSPNTTTNNVTKTFNYGTGDTILIYAYGAILKAADLSRYSFLEFSAPGSNFNGVVIWLGGTIDGNQFNQVWPTNPHGGQYSPAPAPNDGKNQAFVEAHGRFLGVDGADFVLFSDITVVNTVMDGLTGDACNLVVFNNCHASGGASFHYNTEGNTTVGVGEQGSYFKATQTGYKTVYVLNCSTKGGSIGMQCSWPEGDAAIFDPTTLSYFYNSSFDDAAQDNVHIEDCANNVFRRCSFSTSTELSGGKIQYIGRVHISNQTRICVVDRCNFTNVKLDMRNASNMQQSIVRLSNFNSTWSVGNLPFFVYNADNVVGCTFNGKTSSAQVTASYVKRSEFLNFGTQTAIAGSSYVDSCTFTNGTKAIASGSGNYHNTFFNVSTTNANNTPAGTWANVFLNRADLYKKVGGTNIFLSSVYSKY